MPNSIIRILISIVCITLSLSLAKSQSISGKILNDKTEAIPFANIFINELQTGTVANYNGEYNIPIDITGEYELIVSSIGYETKSVKILFKEKAIVKNITLIQSDIELEEIVVRVSKKDPAYEIIQKVIDNKKKYLKQSNSFKTDIYIKAIEEIEQREKKKKRKKANNIDDPNLDPLDVFNLEKAKREMEMSKLNIVEMNVTLNYEYPNKYKEERTGYQVYGDQYGLFIPLLGETDFNFYKNFISLTNISDTPLVSPISRTAFLSYKFKLEETFIENGKTVYKIKVIPKKKGNSTVQGYIYINDEIWNINKLDFKIQKGGLLYFDKFNIKQDYQQINNNLWIPKNIEFSFETKAGKYKKYKGKTTLSYSNFLDNYEFSPNFFKNEIAITTEEAYERDTIYWKNTRLIPLEEKEAEVVTYRDSLRAIYESKEYQDSIQKAFNKITFADFVWDGIGFRNNAKKQVFTIGTIPELLDFSIVGGFRLGPQISYFKQWENGKRFFNISGGNIGLKNADIQGSISSYFLYNPHKFASTWINGGRSFYSINSFDAYLNQLKTSNYILNDKLELGHNFEITNGLSLSTNLLYSWRKSVDNYNTETFVDNIINDNEPPLSFESYNALISEIKLSYTPKRKYMTEPNRKIDLGSKFPTFIINYNKGWKAIGSKVDFDYIDFNITQTIIIGSLGETKYNWKIGKYLNTDDIDDIDLKRFRQSDPYLYSQALESFQSLDTAFATTNLFIEFHHIHHFNGALINNIPLIKKLRIRTVAGGGFLWTKENNYRHSEFFAGLERVFKFGKRRRLRIGVYGVFAKSKNEKPTSSFKISFDIIDTWKRSWSF